MTEIPVASRHPAAPAPSARAFDGVDLGGGALLLGAVLLLALTAPRGGEFWWSDAPRHALNGVFLADLVRDMPSLGAAQRWAMDYYLQYPALTILFYPPLLASSEALAFLVFGPSHAVAIATVSAFYAALVLGAYALARRWLPAVAAVSAALLFCGLAELTLWGRQVMTEIPAYAFLLWSIYFFDRAVAERRTALLYPTFALLLLAGYTKLTVFFIGPVFAGLILFKWRAALRERHAWIGAALFLVALVPLAVMTLKFGQANVQSVTSLPDSQVSRTSLAGWVFYLRRLPHQVGWVPFGAALIGLMALALRQEARARGSCFLALAAAWFAVGYVFFSLIDLKEDRHTVFLLYPVAIVAMVGLAEFLPERWSASAMLLLAAGNFAWILAYVPAPRIEGYAEAARWIVENTPPGRVMFSGQRDGSFIFNLRAADRNRQFTVVRADKLLLNIAVRREIGVTEKDVNPEQLAAMFHDYAMRYVVAERDFWLDLKSMRALQELLETDRFEEVKRIEVGANTGYGDRELRVYRLRGPVSEKPLPLHLDLPIIQQRFEQTTTPIISEGEQEPDS